MDKPQPTTLAKRYPHEFDKRIVFYEEPHIYEVDGKQGYTSVTTWNHSHFEKFDSSKIIDKILTNKKWNTDPTYKYYQKTREDIENMWEENRNKAAQAGTLTHYNIECFYNEMPVEDDSIEYSYFKNFVKDHPHLEAYRTEWFVFHEDLKLAGSIDMLFREHAPDSPDCDEEGYIYHIYDWKRARSIERDTNFNKKAITECIKHLPDTNYWHYALQLNVYRKILKDIYNINVKELWLVVLYPDNSNYEKEEIPILDYEMNCLFSEREKLLKK